LFLYIQQELRPPVGIGPELKGVGSDCESSGRTKRGASLATHTQFLARPHGIILFVVAMNAEAALPHTHLAPDAAIIIPLDYELRWKI